jgi:hypothetical protein
MHRFTIRDLLWLMVVVALAVGLWVERIRADLAVRQMRERSSRNMGLVDTVDTLLRLWETDNPGSVAREGGNGLYIVKSKAGWHYLPAQYFHEKQNQPAKR